MSYKIHPLAEVQSEDIGEGTTIWQFCVVMKGAKIGRQCNICAQVMIENEVVIGDQVTVKSGVQIWDGVTLKDHVFVGPNATFTNDLFPRSKNPLWEKRQTLVHSYASIGANATILAGVEIGAYSMVGAGSVVTRNVGSHEVWYGNPARKRGYVTAEGLILNLDKIDEQTGNHYEFKKGQLVHGND